MRFCKVFMLQGSLKWGQVCKNWREFGIFSRLPSVICISHLSPLVLLAELSVSYRMLLHTGHEKVIFLNTQAESLRQTYPLPIIELQNFLFFQQHKWTCSEVHLTLWLHYWDRVLDHENHITILTIYHKHEHYIEFLYKYFKIFYAHPLLYFKKQIFSVTLNFSKIIVIST
jgi:hypothetical protein